MVVQLEEHHGKTNRETRNNNAPRIPKQSDLSLSGLFGRSPSFCDPPLSPLALSNQRGRPIIQWIGYSPPCSYRSLTDLLTLKERVTHAKHVG